MKLVIEDGIPLPPGWCRAGSGLKQSMDAMGVGQSFLWTGKRSSIPSAASRLRPKKFASRKVEGGVRVWRTA